LICAPIGTAPCGAKWLWGKTITTPANSVPRRIAHLLKTQPDIAREAVLDVGCGTWTPHLRHFGPGSVGVDGQEVTPPEGKHFLRWNFQSDIQTALRERDLPTSFKYVWCSDVFEHVLSPHEFLLNLRRVLRPDGLLFLGVPLVNPLGRPSTKRNSPLNYFRGYLSEDHVNFFTFASLKHTVEFAGYKVEDWYSPFLLGMRRPPRIGIEPVTVLSLSPIPDFQYGPKAVKELVDGQLVWKGYIAGH
jgi:SAM-dependent methyltransferase